MATELKTMQFKKGSQWRKWDLHIHTPGTKKEDKFTGSDLEDKWAEFAKSINKSTQEISVVGITDYVSIENYFKFKKLVQEGAITKKFDLIIPNLEFRMSPVTGKATPINIHFLFNPDIDTEIESRFLSKIKFNYNASDYGASKQELIRLGRDFKTSPKLDEEAAFKTGVEQYVVGFDSLKKVLESDKMLRTNTVVVVSNKSNDGVHGIIKQSEFFSSGTVSQLEATRRSIYQFCDAIFSAAPSDIKYFIGEGPDDKKTVIEKCGTLMACLHGCDAHENSRIFAPDNDKYCWIKADPTFEGLKQILYEPSERVKIQKDEPVGPIRKIDSIEILFPADTTIELIDKKEKSQFCFAGLEEKLFFSDYFTCLIGGRGSGKSTLLNLLYQKLDPVKNNPKFFERNSIKVGANSAAYDYVNIDGSATDVDFLEQNQIEQLATNSLELTRAIYKRIGGVELENLEKNLNESLFKNKIQIKLLKTKRNTQRSLNEENKNRDASMKVVETIQTDAYKDLTKDIKKLSAEKIEIESQRNKLIGLVESVNEIISAQNKLSDKVGLTDYGLKYNEIIDSLAETIDLVEKLDFKKDVEREKTVTTELLKKQEELENYLKSRGLSKEGLADVKLSAEMVEMSNKRISDATLELVRLQKELDKFSLSHTVKDKKKYDREVEVRVEKIKKTLLEVNKQNPDNIDKIDLKVAFNKENADNALIEYFNREFEYLNPGIQLRNDKIQELLTGINSTDIIDGILSIDDFRTKIEGNNKYHQYLEKVFEDKVNFDIFKLILSEVYYDSISHLKVDITYKGKPLEQSSFGQKCTAVIVIITLFGSNPIIIDEPEAHLDSALIANYLVELIKRKKLERQIIFATHNANFVVNADSELIHILEMPENQTEFSFTTLENLNGRDRLLKLEGSELAFKQRRNKYNLISV
jgi:ABC-type lipoprotein export system ATPase subunit